MEITDEKQVNQTGNIKNVLIGLLVGGLAGAVAMLLFAPQSGKQTRAQIQDKGIELRDLTAKKFNKTVAQVHARTDKITADVREKAEEIKQLGQDKLVEQLDRVSAALDNSKKSVEAA